MPCMSCVFYEEIFFYLASLRRKQEYMGNIKRFYFFSLSLSSVMSGLLTVLFHSLVFFLAILPVTCRAFPPLASHSTATTKMTTTAT